VRGNHAATSRVENSAQVSSYCLKFVHGLDELFSAWVLDRQAQAKLGLGCGGINVREGKLELETW
jgi:hypothetical protein